MLQGVHDDRWMIIGLAVGGVSLWRGAMARGKSPRRKSDPIGEDFPGEDT